MGHPLQVMSDPTYDYVIVGAGSAGCVLANRLSSRGSVLVLEAGGWDRDPLLHIPLAWGKVFQSRLHDWQYDSEPEPMLNDRRVEFARGKVIGGSSSTNAMAYVRGHRGDYERWAARSLDAWSYASVLPHFQRQECWEGGGDAYRGSSGPLATRNSRYRDFDPLVDAWLAAGVAAGHPQTADYNGAQQEGFGLLQMTIRNGARCSAATAFLHPALVRSSLRVETRAHAVGLMIEGQRAVGLRYRCDGQLRTARAAREIILAAGVVNSPHLLMLSGIGDPDLLTRHGIAVAAPLRGVGRNLQDHVSIGVEYSRRQPGPFVANMRLDRLSGNMAAAWCAGRGFASDLPSGWTAFLKSSSAATLPDIQLLFRAGPLGAYPYLPPFRNAFADGFACRAVLLRPESRGTVTLASADPFTPPRIAQNFLTCERDAVVLRDGLSLVRDLGRQKPLAPFVGAELMPPPQAASRAELDAHIRATAATAHHPLGTCRMGVDTDEDAVVGQDLRVRGIDGLRVVDASVMPDMIGGNINAAVMMIADKAADLICGGRSAVATRAAREAADV